MKNTKINSVIIAMAICLMMAGCGNTASSESTVKSTAQTSSSVTITEKSAESSESDSEAETTTTTATTTTAKSKASVSDKSEHNADTSETTESKTVEKAESAQTTIIAVEGSKLEVSDMFTNRDLEQTADTTDAETITAESGKTAEITKAGVYVISGTAENFTVKVNAGDDDKVQLVLDGLSVTNDSTPAIYVVNADKVFVTTSSDSTLSTTGTFTADGDTNTDAVIYSKDDIVLNGTATLTINSTANGITGKDDLKVTGGTYKITSSADAIEANDSIRISGGDFTISSSKDGLHAENSDDNTLGYIYISGGTFDINAASDGIQGTTVTQIDGGTFTINSSEGIESTYIQINGGKINITASDDGVNAASKSTAETVAFEMTGGELSITMGSGDTDAVDSNGNVTVSGGTINITCPTQGTAESFDYDGTATFTAGTLIINGEQVDSIPTPMMMGGGMRGGNMGGFGGEMGGDMGNQRGNFSRR